jgi:hypothetical protein
MKHKSNGRPGPLVYNRKRRRSGEEAFEKLLMEIDFYSDCLADRNSC